MAITRLNSLAIPAGTVEPADISYPLTNFSSTGIDDNATSTAITIDANENVGIGVTDPDAKLEVYMSDVATGPYFHGGGSLGLRIADSTVTSAGDRTEFYKPTSSGMFSFKNGLKELLTIKSNGRLGSDETNPQDRIHIKGSLPALRLENTAGAADSYTRIAGIDGALRIQADQGNSTANSFIAFDVDTVERMRIDSAGDVGYSGKLFSSNDVANLGGLQLYRNHSTGSCYLFDTTTAPYNGPLIFGTANTERMRILSSGGITFNGDTTSANALDDYEEGTWTPTVSTSSSVTVYSGVYTKIGNIVNFQCYIAWTNNQNNDGSFFIIGGLPYTSSATSSYHGLSIGYVGAADGTSLLPITQVNNTYIYFHRADSNSATLTNSGAYTRGLAAIILTGHYKTDL